jgi:type II secretory pathway pseudopilin PulG
MTKAGLNRHQKGTPDCCLECLPTFRRSRVHRHVGATLIEVVVVIAILVVIAAVGFTIRGSAIQRANVATCVNHLHSIGQSISLYRADYDFKLPNRELQYYNVLIAPGGGLPSGHRHALTKYGLTLEVAQCPNFPLSDYQYKFAPGRIDYLSRFIIDETERDPTIPIKGYVPRPTDVLAWDRNHINTQSSKDPKTIWSALREDGSVFRVPLPEIKHVYLNKGVWVTKVTDEQENTLPTENVFPGESWPKEALYDLRP